MAQKVYVCDNCETTGKISIKTKGITNSDIVCCPVCGASIWDEDDVEEDDE